MPIARWMIITASWAFTSMGAAQAEVQSLAFTFEPLKCTSTGYFPPTSHDCGLKSISGMFTFNDANGDGHIVLSELIQLTAGLITVPSISPFGPAVVRRFDYTEEKGLSFSAYDGWRTDITTGVAYRDIGPGGSLIYDWFPKTTTRIYPVPEPASAWLLLAGGALVAWRVRRR